MAEVSDTSVKEILISRLSIIATHLPGVLFALNQRLEMINKTHESGLWLFHHLDLGITATGSGIIRQNECLIPNKIAKRKQELGFEEMPHRQVIWGSREQDFLLYRWVSILREPTCCEVNQGRLFGKKEAHCRGQI